MIFFKTSLNRGDLKVDVSRLTRALNILNVALRVFRGEMRLYISKTELFSKLLPLLLVHAKQV